MTHSVKGINTRISHPKQKTKLSSTIANPSVDRASTLIFENYDQFLKADSPYHTDLTYGRSGTSTCYALADSLNELDGYDHTIVVGSGMAAVACSLMAILKSGDHVLFYDAIYKSSKRFIEEELTRLNIQYTFFDNDDIPSLESLFQSNTRALFFEAPGSNTFDMPDIEAIVKKCQANNIVTIFDNSYGACVGMSPLKHGIDICCYSLTKYINGHSDVILGAISFNERFLKDIKRVVLNFAPKASPDDCYLVLRGLKTISLRIDHQYQNALKICDYFSNHPRCLAVLNPGHAKSVDFAAFTKYYNSGNGIFSVVFDLDDKQYREFLNGLKLFKIGLSWGGFESLIMPFNPFNQRKDQKKLIKGKYTRFSIGLENIEDLLADIDNSLN